LKNEEYEDRQVKKEDRNNHDDVFVKVFDLHPEVFGMD